MHHICTPAVSANTIDRFENGRNAPIPATLMALRQAFEAAGVRFTETGGVEPPGKGER
jgi:transcriptional regulator with XRE-family HTH domain